jgi:hypothetical protein
MADAHPSTEQGFGPSTVIDSVHFSIDAEGDLEIDIGTGRRYGTWDGHYFSRDDAMRLRDWLNKVLP